MTQTSTSLSELINDESMPVEADWIRQLQREHPTCLVPVALLMRRNSFLLSDDEAEQLRSALMLGCADPEAMADLADLAQRDWLHFYPTLAPSKPSTESTIDTFLETYGNVSPQESAMIERLIFNPVAPEYLQGTDTAEATDDWSDLMKPAPQAAPVAAVEAAPPQPEPVPAPTEQKKAQKAEQNDFQPNLRLSLAKIFIKQHRYERAFEIINNLCLNNPEKSAYFADQLRFLQKLINNQRFAQAQS